jgi:hypothetical protein
MNAIDEFYLRPERPSLAALQLEVRRRFAERTLAVPNYRTVRTEGGSSGRAHHEERLVLCGVRSHPLCPRFEYKQALNSAI